MTPAEIIDELRENYPDCLLADGLDDAVIGIIDGACRKPVVAYNYNKCFQILMERDGMDKEEATEFLQFNTVGAYVRPLTPLFVHDWRRYAYGAAVKGSEAEGWVKSRLTKTYGFFRLSMVVPGRIVGS